MKIALSAAPVVIGIKPMVVGWASQKDAVNGLDWAASLQADVDVAAAEVYAQLFSKRRRPPTQQADPPCSARRSPHF
jgi:hypothetical protein